MHEYSSYVPDRPRPVRRAFERIAAACALGVMIASFFVGLAVILGLGYDYVVGQALAFCR
jgi:hypothetical protein